MGRISAFPRQEKALLWSVRAALLRDHPAAGTLRQYISLFPASELSTQESNRVARHLRYCKSCSDLVERIARQKRGTLQQRLDDTAITRDAPDNE